MPNQPWNANSPCDWQGYCGGSVVDFARCFLRLSNLPSCALDRLSRYKATLWRQVAQIMIALDAFGHDPIT
jgi:hypothetical protein